VTYGYNTRTIQDHISYQISSYSPDVGVAWVPDIQHINADITIFFLTANSILYTHLNNDLIFGATTKVDLVENNSVNVSYRADNPVAVLGCADQHQWCSAVEPVGKKNCSGLESLNTLSGDISMFRDNPRQLATANRINDAIGYSNMWYVVDPRGVAAIQASETVFEIFQHSLPDNQWTIEVRGWFNTALAKVQQALVEVAVGPVLQNPTDFTVTAPTKPYDWALCDAQIVRSSGQYQNFSVLGLAIIVAFSTFFIWLGSVIDKATGWAQRWFHKGEDRRLQWLLEDKLQLQRMAYVAANQGKWEGHADSVPITTEAVEVDMSLYLPANKKALADARPVEMTQEVKVPSEK